MGFFTILAFDLITKNFKEGDYADLYFVNKIIA
jgi:hypothetical protein